MIDTVDAGRGGSVENVNRLFKARMRMRQCVAASSNSIWRAPFSGPTSRTLVVPL
jgi:hypothetical protein